MKTNYTHVEYTCNTCGHVRMSKDKGLIEGWIQINKFEVFQSNYPCPDVHKDLHFCSVLCCLERCDAIIRERR